MSTRAQVVVAVAIGLVCAAALVGSAWFLIPDKRENIWLEVAKAGIQLATISIVGGGVAAALKYLESAREERRRLNDYRLGVLRDLVGCYNSMKAVRRILRVLGFRSAATSVLTTEQIAEFHTQMKLLNDAQLAIERIGRELRAHPDVFLDTEDLLASIRTVEKYAHDVIEDWENHGPSLIAGTPVPLNSMTHLQSFLASSKSGFRRGAAEPMELLESSIRSHLLPTRQAAPSSAKP